MSPARARDVARLLMAGVLASAVPVGACSSDARPGPLQNCVPIEGGACAVTLMGGGAGTGDSGVCAAFADASACDACAATSCCDALAACFESTACASLDRCETGCAADTACITACQEQYPTGQEPLNTLFDCLSARCTVCAQSGDGDPCAPPYPACGTDVGLTCNGDWCTKACVHSTDCAGFGPSGTNGLGTPNYCMVGAYTCAPGCASTTECADYPGTYCRPATSTENQTVTTCAPLPDAATGD